MDWYHRAALSVLNFVVLITLPGAFILYGMSQTILNENAYGPVLVSSHLDEQLHANLVNQVTTAIAQGTTQSTSAISTQTGVPEDRVVLLADAFQANFKREVSSRFTPGDLRTTVTDVLRRVFRYLKGESFTLDLKPPVHDARDKFLAAVQGGFTASYAEFSASLKSSGAKNGSVDAIDAQAAGLPAVMSSSLMAQFDTIDAGLDSYASQPQLVVGKEYVTFFVKLPAYLFVASVVMLVMLALIAEGRTSKLRWVGVPILMTGITLMLSGVTTDGALKSGIVPGSDSLSAGASASDASSQAITQIVVALLKQMTDRLFGWGVVVALFGGILVVLSAFLHDDPVPGTKPQSPSSPSKPASSTAYKSSRPASSANTGDMVDSLLVSAKAKQAATPVKSSADLDDFSIKKKTKK